MYLAYTPITLISYEIQLQLAIELCIAAICSDLTFNFGEIVSCSVFNSLKNTSFYWLYELINSLNEGNILLFNNIIKINEIEFLKQEKLKNNLNIIKLKVKLLSLINLVFNRSSHDRNITFNEIANVANININEVEWLLMKALSLNLIKGSINQIEQTIQITWILPRVLNNNNIEVMLTQLDTWTQRVKTSLLLVEENATEL